MRGMAMFNKDEFLEVLVKSKKEKVLSDFIFELSKKTGRNIEYLEIEKRLDEDPNSILDLVNMENKDINYLMTSVLQYGYCDSSRLQLPFIIKMKLEKEKSSSN